MLRAWAAAFLLNLCVPVLSARSEPFDDSLLSAVPELRGHAGAFLQVKRTPNRPPSIALAPAPSLVSLEDPWTDAVRAARYRSGPPRLLAKILNGLLLEDPLFPTPLLAPLLDRFPAAKAREIAAGCLARWPEWWDRIGCASQGVNRELSTWKFKLPSTACKMHAAAFNDVFAGLGLGSARSQWIDASFGKLLPMHVANVLMVQDAEGRVFSYVIDSGWFPGKLFPLNGLAVSLHDRNHDGKTDSAALPKISEHPVSRYYAAER